MTVFLTLPGIYCELSLQFMHPKTIFYILHCSLLCVIVFNSCDRSDILPNIIAMGFPEAASYERMYHNTIEDVARYELFMSTEHVTNHIHFIIFIITVKHN